MNIFTRLIGVSAVVLGFIAVLAGCIDLASPPFHEADFMFLIPCGMILAIVGVMAILLARWAAYTVVIFYGVVGFLLVVVSAKGISFPWMLIGLLAGLGFLLPAPFYFKVCNVKGEIVMRYIAGVMLCLAGVDSMLSGHAVKGVVFKTEIFGWQARTFGIFALLSGTVLLWDTIRISRTPK